MVEMLPYNIPAMTDGDPLVPIKGPFRTLAQGVSDAFGTFRRSLPYNVASQSERNTFFPSPTQGNRVFRTDLGYEEMYYDIYSAVGNPGGAKTRGWYPTGPNSVFGMLARSGSGVQLGGGAFNALNTTAWWKAQDIRGMSAFAAGWTIPFEGIWSVSAGIYVASGANLYAGITVNNTSASVANFVAQSNRTSYAVNNTVDINRDLYLAAGDVLRLFVLPGETTQWSTMEPASWFNVKFNGVRRAV